MKQISAFVPLSTKLFIPNVRPDLVPRPRLIAQMDHGASRKLTLVSAPAGFGKTTLVACWLRGQTQKTVWLSLDQLDNELLRLIAYIVAGFRAIDPKAMAATAALLDDSTMPLIEHYVQSFVADLLDFGQPVHLAIDDYHTINNREIHEFFIRLIANQPANLHLIIATRSDPLLPLPKLRVADEIIEIRVADLRFSTQEVSEYIISSMGEAADIETIDSTILQEITRNTEGWIAGLRLLMLAVHSHNSDNPLAERVASRARDLAIDYLIAEVLQYQPEDVRQFLLFSSIVDRFHTDLVAELTGQSTSQVQETLSTVVAANLFVVQLDNDQSWFRYHHLFQTALRQRMAAALSAEEMQNLFLQASAWFAERGLIGEAVQYALAGKDLDRAVALVETNSRNYLNGIERRQLEDWLAKLPDGEIWQRPALLTAKAWLFYRHWRVDELAPILDQLEQIIASDQSMLSDEQRSGVSGHIFTLRACLETLTAANPDRIIAASLAALKGLPLTERGGRATALGYQAIAMQLRGDQDEAFDLLESELANPSPGAPAKVQLYLSLCLLCERIGDFARMENAVRRFLAIDPGSVADHSGANWMAGRVAYERNQIDRAHKHFSLTVARQHSTNFLAAATSMMGLVRILLLRDHLDEAQSRLDHALAECYRLHNRVLLLLLESVQAELWIKFGQPHQARTWAQSVETPSLPIGPALTDSLLENWARVCLLLAEAGKGEADLLERVHGQLLSAIESTAAIHPSCGTSYRIVRLRLLLAATELAMGNRVAAKKRLPELLPPIESGHLVRSVLDMGIGLAPLLCRYDLPDGLAAALRAEAQKRRTNRFSRTVGNVATQPSRSSSLDLTRREEEILGLMQQGHSNQEIADDLVISLYTVKRHATNIYNKMAVSNRRQAVRAAVAAGLLQAS